MKIATLTLNPALDKNTFVERLQPEKKLRCEEPEYEAGGGGINVSRAIAEMGGKSIAIFASGGAAGDKLDSLLPGEGIEKRRITIKKSTRVNLLVTERSTGNQYRFGMPGDSLTPAELQKCIDEVKALPDSIEYLVASGSLPPGAPADLYARISLIAKEKNMKFILDATGEAFEKAAETGLYLIKPNLRELSQMAGKEHISGVEQEEIASGIIKEGKSKIVILSMGPRGAMMVTKERTEYVVPPTVKTLSTVGAGDSMVAGIVLSLSRGEDPVTALRWGVSAGTAATMTSGRELCRRNDVERLYSWIVRNG